MNIRFTDHTLRYEEQKTNLTLLMQSYLASMADLGAETWIIHGTLLGWWWNRKVRILKTTSKNHWLKLSDTALGLGH